MGELFLMKESKSRCCLDCHYLSKYNQLNALQGGEVVLKTWNSKERSNLSPESGKSLVATCAKEEWIDKAQNSVADTIQRDRSNCVSFADFEDEPRFERVARFQRVKSEERKEKIDKRRFVVLVLIGVAGLIIGAVF